jgi:sterol desaturase/sphingolipid hydroxylase (fatty acid hydroxylase superfamily)
VTSSFWDKVFGTAGDPNPRRPVIVARRSTP